MSRKKIDIGCGPRPQKGYDAYTDIYMPKQVAQNSEVKKRFTKTPLEDMGMFKDKEFDFAFCHHVIEHVEDPDKACSELVRIAKSGILYFPSVQAEILFGRTDHNWIIFQRPEKPNHLFFIKKRYKSYYTPRTVPKDARAESPLNAKPLKWKDKFTWTVAL